MGGTTKYKALLKKVLGNPNYIPSTPEGIWIHRAYLWVPIVQVTYKMEPANHHLAHKPHQLVPKFYCKPQLTSIKLDTNQLSYV